MPETGKPLDRVEAKLKVTGKATYAAEFNQPGQVYAFPVRATIGKGAVKMFDTKAAERSSGVIAIITTANAPRLKELNPGELRKNGGMLGEQLVPLQDNKVNYYGQYIGLVIAQTYEQARTAAELVKVSYTKETPAIDLDKELPNGYKPQKMQGEEAQLNEGQAAPIIAAAQYKIEETYTTSTENHHPMEPHATIAIWDGADKLKLYDATQGVMGVRGTVAYFFDLKMENVQVLSPYLGGGFGTKGSQWGHILLAVMGAKVAGKPVKLVITRQMMQTNTGRRAATEQKMGLATDKDGKLTALLHHTDSYTNLSEFFEPSGKQSTVLYSAPVREVTYKIAKLNIGTPTFMRAPGEASGTFALESAMDEMAYKMNIDPVEFRKLNHTSVDPVKKLPFSSDYLLECYDMGAAKFGWNSRKMQPRQNRNGKYLVGYGMATATYPANRSSASARVQLMPDGVVHVETASSDLGTGTYTIITQTTADALGVPLQNVKVRIGDSNLPPAPVSGGSQSNASVNPAVFAACEQVKNDLVQLAIADSKSPLFGKKAEDITIANAALFLKENNATTDSYTSLMNRNNKVMMEACAAVTPASSSGMSSGASPCSNATFDADVNGDKKKYAFHSFGAQFAEVWVDEDLGTIRVKRFVSVIDAGKISNEKTARSQVMGGVIYGLGAALMEETAYDLRYANPVARGLGDYHLPVHLDAPPVEVYFIGKPDLHISPLGARGIGEIGITGVSAAVANAVFNATGKRLRHLPFTPDKLIMA